eukprot:gene11537-13465_t
MPNLQGLSLNSGQSPVNNSNLPNPMTSAPASGSSAADNRINLSQVPSPAAVLDAFKTYVYTSNGSENPPPSSVQQLCIDQGCATPTFVRSTLYTIPESEDVLTATSLPLAIHTTPLAIPGPGEAEVPLIDHGPEGPVRCSRCLGYMNPHNTFLNGGRFFSCKLCDYENDVPQSYFSATLQSGLRTDADQRPELQRGSYEFVAKPTPNEPKVVPAYIFVIEVSAHTVSTGVLFVIIESLRKILNEMYDKTPKRIGIITYDTEVHFWSFKKNYNLPQMKVIAKNSVFVPMGDGFLTDYVESKHLFDHFFDNVTNFFKSPLAGNREFAFGAAVQSAALTLEKCGGRLFAFTSNMPKGLPGAVPKRDGKVDKTLLPSTAFNGFYKPVATQCVASNVSVDIFVTPSEVCDLTTTGPLATSTGGHVFYYPHFNADTADQLRSDIIHYATMSYGFNAAIKIRCSRGLTVQAHHGNFVEENGEVRIAGITADKCITSIIKYDDRLKPKSKAYIQFAMAYTNMCGEKRIRVHNVRLNVDSVTANFFKDADLDSIVTLYARLAARDIITTAPSAVRIATVEKGVDLLASYRKNCAADKSHTQLILPECFKLLPIYILSMMKSAPFRLSTEVSPDLRFYYMNMLASLPPSRIIPLIYPRTYPIHNMLPEHGTVNQQYNHVILPPFVRLSSEQITQDGVFLIEDGRNIYCWVQQFASQTILHNLFGIDSIVGYNSSKISKLFTSLNGSNEYHMRVETLISTLIHLRGHYAGKEVQFVVANEYLDSILRGQFYEDKGTDSVSYVDFLCQLHRQIQSKLS